MIVANVTLTCQHPEGARSVTEVSYLSIFFTAPCAVKSLAQDVILSVAKPRGPIAQQIGNPWLNLRSSHRELEFRQWRPHFMPPVSDGNFQSVFRNYGDCSIR
jgi:hypothetical protein